MRQIITQHGWGLDQNFWGIYKLEFQRNNWNWQDNDRGYFSKNPTESKWITNKSDKQTKMILCHSLGLHLIQKKLFKEATHIVFINSFNNFLPLGKKRNLILRSLKRMENKISKSETEDILKEFIDRSFRPNYLNADFKNNFYRNLKNLNKSLLLEDLKKLYTDGIFPEIISKNCKIIFIRSENDLILDKDSSNNFLEFLRKIFANNLTLIELPDQGHCLTNFNLYETINNSLVN